MGRLKGIKWHRLGTTFMFVLTVVAAQLSGVFAIDAYAAVKTWTGAGSDNRFSTAANWSGNSVPVDGDILVITAPPSSGSVDLIDDINTKFGGVQVSGSDPDNNYHYYRLQGELNLQDGATYSVTLDGFSFYVDSLNGSVKVDGDFVLANGSAPSNLTVDGVVTYQSGASGYLSVPGATRIVVENGALSSCNPFATYATPVTLGGGAGNAPLVSFGACMGAGGGEDPVMTATLGDVTLAADAHVWVYGNDIVKVEQLTGNGHTLTRAHGADGTLILPGGVKEETIYQPKTTEILGDKSGESVVINPKETGILKGTRDSLFVRGEGVLRGSGTVRNLNVDGTIAPGNSPGTITVLEYFTLSGGSTYEAEILNTGAYDQIKAGDVWIGGSLNLSLLPGAVIETGNTFTIIDNTGSQPVGGTFEGLDEGAHITVRGVVFSISYAGGDGNDIVLTALTSGSVPAVPNTGALQIVTANPAVAALAGIIAVAGALYVWRRIRQ